MVVKRTIDDSPVETFRSKLLSNIARRGQLGLSESAVTEYRKVQLACGIV